MRVKFADPVKGRTKRRSSSLQAVGCPKQAVAFVKMHRNELCLVIGTLQPRFSVVWAQVRILIAVLRAAYATPLRINCWRR